MHHLTPRRLWSQGRQGQRGHPGRPQCPSLEDNTVLAPGMGTAGRERTRQGGGRTVSKTGAQVLLSPGSQLRGGRMCVCGGLGGQRAASGARCAGAGHWGGPHTGTGQGRPWLSSLTPPRVDPSCILHGTQLRSEEEGERWDVTVSMAVWRLSACLLARGQPGRRGTLPTGHLSWSPCCCHLSAVSPGHGSPTGSMSPG